MKTLARRDGISLPLEEGVEVATPEAEAPAPAVGGDLPSLDSLVECVHRRKAQILGCLRGREPDEREGGRGYGPSAGRISKDLGSTLVRR